MYENRMTAQKTSSAKQNEPNCLVDHRAIATLQRKRQFAADHCQKPIQKYTYQAGTTRKVKIQGSGKSCTFEECTSNRVEYKKDDAKQTGTSTGEASWKGWLVNTKGGNNATQLHIVNRRWGGLGGAADKNIVPGTPAENSHHLHEAETPFDRICFGGKDGTHAKKDAKYECTATPSYSTSEDVSAGEKKFSDPALSVKITADGVTTAYPVTTGTEGLTMKQGA